MNELPRVINRERDDERPYYECSEHGDTVIVTIGQWTGRRMLECASCGCYIVDEHR